MDERFEIISSQALKSEAGINFGSAIVLRDRQTGVLYLWCRSSGVGGLTVMLDQNGKPVTMNYRVTI